jgi:Pentapeptide repeats (9 copies)
MSEGTDVKWPACDQDGCIGVRLASARMCLAHGSEEETAAALKLVGETGEIDARGVSITPALLEQVLAAVPRGEAGHPLIKHCNFSEATFTASAGFAGVTFSGDAEFAGATFERGAGFDEATFGGGAGFLGATFSGETRFLRTTFNGEAAFGGVPFKGGARFPAATFDGIALFLRAAFKGAASFEMVPFKNLASFNEATFERGAGFTEATFDGGAGFLGTTFDGEAYFNRATFKDRADFGSAIFKGGAGFNEATFKSVAGFSGATFKSEAGFWEATFDGEAGFGRATFGDEARFLLATFDGAARFNLATFDGPAWFGGATFKGEARFAGAAFKRAQQFGPMLAHRGLNLDGVQFAQPVSIEASTTGMCCRRARFPGGVQFRLRWARVVLDDTDLSAPSLLSGIPRLASDKAAAQEKRIARAWQRQSAGQISEQPRLLSLQRANVAGLGLGNVDLADCRFNGAHNLDKLRLEADVVFGLSPAWAGWERRQVIAEESAWRAKRSRPGRWTAPWWPDWAGDKPRVLSPGTVAGVYRALRKGREDIKDD